MVRDGAVGSIGSPRRDQLLDDARKMATLDADQPAVAQLLLHEEVRQMAPRHAREDNLLLHLVIRDGAFVRAFDEEMAFAGGASHGVAQDGLREGAQPRRRERPGRDEREEAGRDDRHHRHGAEVEPFEALVGLVDAMHDEVRFVVEEALPRPRDGFVVELDPRSRVTREEATQQREHPAPWRRGARSPMTIRRRVSSPIAICRACTSNCSACCSSSRACSYSARPAAVGRTR